jgi:ABC-type nitrate/sulfonate/bicarbonate transport system permease component
MTAAQATAPATAQAATRPTTPRRTAWGVVRSVLYAVGLPLVLLAAWWVATADSESPFNPPLSEILATFGPTWFSGDSFADTRFVQDVLPSLGRLLVGYAIALVLGIGLGVLIGAVRPLRELAEPVLEFFRAIPPPVMVPVLMLFLGVGTSMRVFVIATGALWPILLNTVEGVRGLDPVLKDTARAFRFGRWGRVRRLMLPGASPQIVTGARQALSIAIILMVISEMFAARDGLGFSVVQFQRSFAVPEMWSGVIMLGLLGVLLSFVFRVATAAVLAWYHGYLRSQRGGA